MAVEEVSEEVVEEVVEFVVLWCAGDVERGGIF